MKKFFKVIIKISAVILVVGIAAAAVFALDAATAKLSPEKLAGNYSQLKFYDNGGAEVEETGIFYSSKPSENLNKYTYDAFVAIEDKRFYSHNGVDVRRMFGAAVENLKSFSFKEGASTITQQLIKNTQLTPEKTLFRKSREIKLALEIEKLYTKRQIIDMYLNIIYFGGGCYGIENASQFYFNKNAQSLTLNESAALAAIIKAPSAYSPFNNYGKMMARKNLVLKLMKENNMISGEEYKENYDKDITLNNSKDMTNEYNDYLNACLNEVSEILGIPLKELKNSDYKIYTYMDRDLQKKAYSIIKDTSYYKNTENDSMSVILDNGNFSVSALCVKSKLNLDSIIRQPGSAIKPVLVYAPAIEFNTIMPATQILDEKTDFEGYSPENYNDKYYGYISARDSLAKSLNVPAVKILNSTGTEKSKIFAKRCGIKFAGNDNSLAIALGGFTEGCAILDLAGSYVPFSNGGIYKTPQFIKKITDGKGREVYADKKEGERVMRSDTAYLICDMLKESVKSGTASKLSGLNIPLCSKTGTVGNSGFNTDAYNISYTTKNTFCVWMGSVGGEKLDLQVTGGTFPTLMAKDLIKACYNGAAPDDFASPDSVVKCDIDIKYLNENHVIKLASDMTPEKYVKTEIFSSHYQPREVSDIFTKPKVEDALIEYNDYNVTIKFTAKDYLTYEILRRQDNEEKVIKTVKNKNGVINMTDNNLKGGKTYQYIITPAFKGKKDTAVTGEAFVSEKIVVPFELAPGKGKDKDKNNDNRDNWWGDNFD